MTSRERFLAVMSGEQTDRLPLTIWNNKLPGEGVDEQLLALDVCVVNKSTVWQCSFEGVGIECREERGSDGDLFRHTTYTTPAGPLSTIERVLPLTVWLEKFPFGGPEDFEAVSALIASRRYTPDHATFNAADWQRGGQSIARPVAIHSPMHDLIYEMMGIENFSLQWAENRDALLSLYDIMKEDWVKRVEAVAASPASFAVVEGNTEFTVVGEERFMRYYYPHIEEACEILHARGKYAGAHFDGNNQKLAPLVARTSLDFIESFTPPPDCDLPLADARRVWPGKSIMLHFPSSLHRLKTEEMLGHAADLLRQAGRGDRLVIGTSEDLPDRGVRTLVPLYRFLHERSALPLN
jgi:hypothetical protein